MSQQETVVEKEKERQERRAAELKEFANIWDIDPSGNLMEHSVNLVEIPRRLEPYFKQYLGGGGHVWKMGAFTAQDIPLRQTEGWAVFNPNLHLPLPESMPEKDRWTSQKMLELGVREVNGAVMFGREMIICVQRMDYREKMLAKKRERYQRQFELTTGAVPQDEGDTRGGYTSSIEEEQVEVKPFRGSPNNKQKRGPGRPRKNTS